MKKLALVLLTFVLVCTLVAPAFAARSAFSKVELNNNDAETKYIPNAEGRARMDNVIQYMEAYGCGYGTKGDMVEFVGLDFGSKGADKMTLSFSYNDVNTSTLAVHIDDPKASPVATFAVTDTGGWDIAHAKEFTTDVKIAGGVHDIYIEFTNEESGSFSYCYFNEAAEAIGASQASTSTATATADMGVIASIAAIMTSAAGFVALNKKH